MLNYSKTAVFLLILLAISCTPKKKEAKIEKNKSLFEKGLVVATIKGKKIEESDLIFKRPGLGIEPHLVSKIIGQTSKKKIKEDSWIKWSMLKK